jgi:hypothetical protein
MLEMDMSTQKFLKMLAGRHLNIEKTAANWQQNNGRKEIRKAVNCALNSFTQYIAYLYLHAKIIKEYPHLFGGHDNEVGASRAMDLVGQYHNHRRFREVSFLQFLV